MNTFGGFSGNPDIESFLLEIEADFTEMVCSHSILLSEYKRKSKEVLRIAQRQAYPRIGLRLSAAKDKDTNLLLFSPSAVTPSQVSSPGYDSGRIGVYEHIITLITASNSPFAEGVTNVAAALTAAILIKQIPLNSDIKNIELGKDIEERAFEDLEKIVEVFSVTKNSTVIPVDVPNADRANQTIYIALDIDKNTLPAQLFNNGLVDERIILDRTIDDVVPNVRALDYLTISPDKVAFCWFYISGTQYEGAHPDISGDKASTPSLYSYDPIESAFIIRDGYGADDVISILSDSINELTLNPDEGALPSTKIPTSNIIASPNRGELTLSYVTIPKKKLYPDEDDKTYDRKMASFRVLQRYNYLTFDARRVSSVVSRELVIIRFFTADKATLSQTKFEADGEFVNSNLNLRGQAITFRGDWDENTTYNKGDLVNYLNGSYVARQTGINRDPTNRTLNTPYWAVLYTDAIDLIPYKSRAIDYIDGLVYGLSPNYVYLDKKGPRSIIFSVKDGNLKVLNAKSESNSSSSPKEYPYSPDTFYFRLAEGFFSVSGNLKIRVASTKLQDVPEIYSFVDPIDSCLNIPIASLSAEEVALEVLKAIHTISQYTDVLAALTLPNALQFTAFKTTKQEVKEVIDILELPPGLEIATGVSVGYQAPKLITEYRSKPRSLVIVAELMDSALLANSLINGMTNGDYSVAATTYFKKSGLISSVKDKINLLNNRRY